MLATDESRYTRMAIPAYPRSSASIRGSRSSIHRTVTKDRTAGEGVYEGVYEYRFGQRLKNYTTDIPGEETAVYNYDGLGKRRLKIADDAFTWYRWDAGWNMIGEYQAGTDPNTIWDIGDRNLTYFHGPRMMEYLGGSLGASPGSGIFAFAVTDRLMSIRGLYSSIKESLKTIEYTPYGEFLRSVGIDFNPGFTGHYGDNEEGVFYTPYRYYLPNAGRWLTRDPLGMVDGPNTYAYVKNAPTRYRDAVGLVITDAESCFNTNPQAGACNQCCDYFFADIPGNLGLALLTCCHAKCGPTDDGREGWKAALDCASTYNPDPEDKGCFSCGLLSHDTRNYYGDILAILISLFWLLCFARRRKSIVKKC